MFSPTSFAGVRNVLCLGAHADDIEIGCGGAILRLMAECPDAAVRWVVFSADDRREAEARATAARFLGAAPEGGGRIDFGRHAVVVRRFRDGFFPYDGGEIKAFFETLKKGPSPDLVFTHLRDDLHQDHALLNRLTGNTFRDHWILEYEIPKYDGDLGHPNTFVQLDEATVARKVGHLLAGFPSQAGKAWFTEDTFRAVLRLRGVECNAPGKFAEGFHCRKLCV